MANKETGSLDEWLSQRSAKPCTAVRIRQEPPLPCTAIVFRKRALGSLDEWLSQRSAKPCTAVRIRQEPPQALLAQLVEQLTLNQWVQGSNP